MKKYFFNLVLCSFALLLSVGSVSAQQQVAPNSDSTVILCSDEVGVYDLGALVYGASLKGSDGTWDLVSNDIASTDLAAYVSGTSAFFVQRLDDEKYNFAGLAPGLYSFVYTSKTSACLPMNEKVIARVLIVQNAKNESKKLFVCDSETLTLNLRSILDLTLQDSAILLLDAAHTSGLLNTNGLALTATPGSEQVVITGADLFAVDNTMATFSFKYYNRQAPCRDTATVTVTIDPDKTNVDFASDSLALCITEMDSVYQISYYTKVEVAGGVWTGPGAPVTVVDDAIGEVKFNTFATGDYVFTYTYPDCEGVSQSKTFTINVTDELTSTGFVSGTDSLCKSEEPDRIYDLMLDGFGADIYAGSGTWTQEPTDPVIVAIDADGKVSAYEFEVGEYHFTYRVSNALENSYCGIRDSIRMLTLRVGDLSGNQLSAADHQLCLDATYAATDSLSLPGLVTGIDLVNVVRWIGPSGITISSTGNVSKADLATLPAGEWKFTLEYSSEGCNIDELGELSLYVDNTWEIDQSDTVRLFCRTVIDTMRGFNMREMTGVEGTYKLIGIADSNGTPITTARDGAGAPVAINGSFGDSYIREAASIYSALNSYPTVTYTVEFTPSSAACGAEVVTLKLTFTGEEFGTVIIP